jgi:hypothetical protein
LDEGREENSLQETLFESIAHLPYYQDAWSVADLVTAADRAARHGDLFFEHPAKVRFTLENGLSFTSPYRSPHPENNTARALWYPCAGSTRSAVILVPHWGTRPGDYKTLCRILNRVGISCLEMVTPYHGERTPKGCAGAEYAVSPDLVRTIATARQAVLEIRCGADWLNPPGAGTRIDAGRFAGALEGHQPSTYFHRLRYLGARSLLIYGRYDKTFRREHSVRTVEAFRALRLDYKAVELRCGHQSLGWFPFNLIDAYQICNYLKENL